MLVFLINILLVSGVFSESADSRKNDAGILAVFWNLENFFDYTDIGAGDSDAEFSGTGSRHWTKSRYWKKCHGIAKTFLWIAGECGRLPDVAGVAEVENRAVVRTVINGTLLRKFDYACVHHDSPDTRGIDVALVYRTGIFRKAGERTIAVNMDADGNPVTTRDILYVCLETVDRGVKYHFLVNHHPSKYGGEQVSEGRRMAAMRKMVSFCDSLAAAGERNIICMGDFNDTPDGPAFAVAEESLVNMAVPLADKGLGTIKYAGKWDLIDMFLVSEDVAPEAEMEIAFPDFLLTKDNAHSGLKPLRTYTGPRYSGGISDHLPIVLYIGYGDNVP